MTGAFVVDPERYMLSPILPAACSPAVLSVAERSHVVGSVVPVFHTLACTVVGDVPTTERRTLTRSPATSVTFGTRMAGAITVVVPTVRSSARVARPFEASTILAW